MIMIKNNSSKVVPWIHVRSLRLFPKLVSFQKCKNFPIPASPAVIFDSGVVSELVSFFKGGFYSESTDAFVISPTDEPKKIPDFEISFQRAQINLHKSVKLLWSQKPYLNLQSRSSFRSLFTAFEPFKMTQFQNSSSRK